MQPTMLMVATIGNGDGLIQGLFNAQATPAATTAESNSFWQHERLSGFLTGNGTNPPTNAVGGVIGVQGGVTTFGMTGNVVCSSNIPWKIAQAVDTQLDDGNSDTGNIRAGAAATVGTATTTSAVYGTGFTPSGTNTDGLHTVCQKI